MTPWYSVLNDNTIDFRIDFNPTYGLEAAKITIEQIMKNYPPPYNLMVSGGVDSQAMLYAWKLFGKDYIPTSVIYNKGLNKHDLETLAIFANRERIEVTYIDFDLLVFYNTDYPAVCEKYRCVSPHFGAHLGMTEHLPGTVIFSGDRLSDGAAAIGRNNICILEASKTRSIVPYFFMHTPEIAYSAFYNNYKLVSKHQSVKESYLLKCKLWHSSGFPIIPQNAKYTGFEKVKNYYDARYGCLVTNKMKLKFSHRASIRAYDMLLRYPYEDKFGNEDFVYLFNPNLQPQSDKDKKDK